MGPVADVLLAAPAVALAVAMRPWRMLRGAGPPWTWVALVALLPWWWSLDQPIGIAVLPTLSGAALLVLMAGWPLTVLATLPIAALTAWAGGLDAAEALHRAVWLGIVPATIVLGLGAAARRWLPRHVCSYVAARGFAAAGLAVFAAGALGESPSGDGWIALALMAMGEAGITGVITTALVVWQPRLLATYSDALYLPLPRERPRRLR